MNKYIQGLIGLLVIQVIIALAMFWSEQTSTQSPESIRFVDVAKNDIDKVIIADSEQSVELTKENEQWALHQWQGVPADDSQLSVALNKLIDLNSTWPVTTTANSHDRFKVSEDNFQRRLTLYSGEQIVGGILLGSSPGFRKLHIRKIGEDPVYSVELNNYDFPAESKAWLDKSLLAVSEIQAFELDDFKVKQVEGQWILTASDMDALLGDTKQQAKVSHGGVELQASKVNPLLDRIEKLSVITLAEAPDQLNFDKATRLKVSANEDYEFLFLEQDGKHFVKRNDLDWVFETNGMANNQLAEFNAKDMVASKKSLAESDESSDDGEQTMASGLNKSSAQ